MKRRPLLVCVSGSDGTGKSSLVKRVATDLRGHGYAVTTRYCYGCVVCRRLPHRLRFRFTASPPEHHRSIAARLRAWTGRLHGWVDATELAVHLSVATAWARLSAGPRPAAVVTDRGPLDGLVKFDPPPGSRLASAFTRLSGNTVALLLDADPDVCAQRDGEHASRTLSGLREDYRRWATHVPNVQVLDASASPAAVAAEALSRVPGPEPPEETNDGSKRVVISTFDDSRNPHYHGGGALLMEKVAHRLAEEYDVTVVTVGRRGGVEMRDGVRYLTMPLGWAGPRVGQLLYHALLFRKARRLHCDLWLEGFTPPFSTSFLPLSSRSRVVGIAQCLSAAGMSRKYHLPFWVVERWGLRFYRDVVVMNEVDGMTVSRHSPRCTAHLIPNGVEQPPAAPQQFGDGAYIAFLGRVDVWVKGLDLLLAAHAGSSSPMPLLLAGAGPRREESKLTRLLAETGADARWIGEVTGAEKHRFLQRCAFMVLPSRTEAFGIAALECMSYGKPVLHFDLPSLRWMDEGGAVAVPSFDVGAMGRQLRALSQDEELRRRLGHQAYEVAQGFSWERTTEHYAALARRMLSPCDTARDASRSAAAQEVVREEAGAWQPNH